MMGQPDQTRALTPEQYDELCRRECFVCAIVAERHRPNTQVVYEDADVIAFLNHFPTQQGYTLVCPKRHAERFERELAESEWLHLQEVVQRVAAAVAQATGAMRIYLASLGSPERNAHLHVHVCPCPAGTPFELQQFEAMRSPDGLHHEADPDRQREVAQRIRAVLEQVHPTAARLMVRPLLEGERQWLAETLEKRWGSTMIVSRGVTPTPPRCRLWSASAATSVWALRRSRLPREPVSW
jgi:histidine triad (HIT) family protein